MSRLERSKSWLDVVVSTATILAIGFGAWKFRQYRSLVESATLTITPTVVEAARTHLLYIDVDVQNIGNVNIDGRRCAVTVTPMAGPAALQPLPQQAFDRLNETPQARLYTIDKGEINTFTFAFEVPEAIGTQKLTAVRIDVDYNSSQVIGPSAYLGWTRQTIVTFEGKKRNPPASPAVGATEDD